MSVIRSVFKWGWAGLLLVGMASWLSGCAISSEPPAGFLCKSDFDCLADQICVKGKCLAQVNRPLPQPDAAPPPDLPGTTDNPDTTDSTTDEPPQVDFGLPPDEPAPDLGGVCGPGTRAPCYQGPSGTSGKGVCKTGTTTCQANRQWGPCVGQVLPSPAEICEDGQDNNCNGQIDENCTSTCTNGDQRSCYTGPSTTRSIGLCKAGLETCKDEKWSPCEGEVTPKTEVCNDNRDNDCDGRADEDCNSNCPEGQQRPCYTGLAGCTRQSSGSYICKGVCKAGAQRCTNGAWGACTGDAKDSPERCNGQDDDCDGDTDEGITGSDCVVAGQKGACAAGKSACSSGKLICTQNNTPIPEKCDNKIDDDCDGQTDEDCMSTVVILTSMTPNTGSRGSTYKGTLVGAGFLPGAVVEISAANLPTPSFANISSFNGKTLTVKPNEITIDFLPISTTLNAGNYLFRVLNPGNNPSNTVLFVLSNQTGGNGATITSLAPNTADVGKSYSGTFTGTGYDVGATVEIRAPVLGQFIKLSLLGAAVSIVRVSSTKLTLSLSSTPGDFNGISLKGSHDVRIVNPNGKFSNTVKLTIK